MRRGTEHIRDRRAGILRALAVPLHEHGDPLGGQAKIATFWRPTMTGSPRVFQSTISCDE